MLNNPPAPLVCSATGVSFTLVKQNTATPSHTKEQNMNKEYFELIAQYINSIMDPHARVQAAIAVGSACQVANPLFDVDSFYSACGI